jgi:predicted TIM-barrel fold metal-dependent hydrolase
MVRDHPGRFGMFATMPMPDVDGTLREIEYALDVLKADGIGFMTSFGDKWLGDPAFTPVFDELNRRQAVVYTHPTTPECCRSLVRDVPPSTIEFATDTTRTIASVLFSGTATRCPNVRFIFSHGGGTLPFLTGRIVRLAEDRRELAARLPLGPVQELKRFHYELAQAVHPMALAALLKLVPVTQVLFGTDFPFRPAAEVVQGIAEHGFGDADRRAIERDNALALLPRVRA